MDHHSTFNVYYRYVFIFHRSHDIFLIKSFLRITIEVLPSHTVLFMHYFTCHPFKSHWLTLKSTDLIKINDTVLPSSVEVWGKILNYLHLTSPDSAPPSWSSSQASPLVVMWCRRSHNTRLFLNNTSHLLLLYSIAKYCSD